ncbi:hypothetical protein RJ640_002600 [Escallonia rubra]|uniref:Pectinesterase catalytic domain-containing protein n=1 Tax=Escallonia rubra TaxID=112253 RepID=A0AA88R8V0_9ASTE|nr:hypothetical protein RJ640_002600 [Escallonia rubra]
MWKALLIGGQKQCWSEIDDAVCHGLQDFAAVAHMLCGRPSFSVLRSDFNATVAQDRSGDYIRITHTIVVAPVLSQTHDYAKTKPGIYDEHVEVWSNKSFIALIGDGTGTTKITHSRHHARGFSGPDSTTWSKLLV